MTNVTYVFKIANKEKHMDIKSEKELGDIFLQILKILGYEYWCEVKCPAGIIDVVALKDDIYYTFHLKTKLSNKVLEQAYNCGNFDTIDYVVVPPNKSKYARHMDIVQKYFCENFNIGVYEVNKHAIKNLDFYTEHCNCSANKYHFLNTIRCIEKDSILYNIKDYLYDTQKNDLCGVKGGGYDTDFKRTFRFLKEYYTENEYISIKQTWEDLKDKIHYSSKSGLSGALSELRHLEIVQDARNVMMDKKIK